MKPRTLAAYKGRQGSVMDVDPVALLCTVATLGLAGAREAGGITYGTWMRLLELHPDLEAKLETAERFYLEGLARKLLPILEAATDEFELKKAKLIGDRIAWLLERRAPDRYGTRVQMSVAHTFDLRVAVDEARERVAAVGVEVRATVVTRLLG